MSDSPILGWDIGGAHLKGARLEADGEVTATVQVPCPLWQGLDPLREAFRRARRELGEAPRHAATMTGELVDAFAARREGVKALAGTAGEELAGAEHWIYAGAAGFFAPADAADRAREVASANWHATAALAARVFGEGLLVDVGSTTTDLVPFAGGVPSAEGTDDGTRLAGEELVYTGVSRTPVFALADRAPFAGEWTPLMAEAFANAADVHRITGDLPQGADQHPTPDGAGKTPEASARRLARMVGRDREDASREAWWGTAAYLAECQLARLHSAASRLLSRPGIGADAPVVAGGAGRFVAERLAQRLNRPHEPLDRALGPGPSEGLAERAPAVAVARLLAEAYRTMETGTPPRDAVARRER